MHLNRICSFVQAVNSGSVIFCSGLWPDFDEPSFDQALASYHARERRFGRTSEQLKVES
ncbi:MAG: hypothetical protein EBS73_00760 [Betaproteobacteria bacterium]|nr:hypothetical protein [Betaproteobacteria bacterium]